MLCHKRVPLKHAVQSLKLALPAWLTVTCHWEAVPSGPPCPHRVREAAMTTLMDVTLLLGREQPELIEAPM